jgi:hypothetical protein
MLELEAFLLTGVSLMEGRAAVVRTGVVGGFMVEKGMVVEKRDASRAIIIFSTHCNDRRKESSFGSSLRRMSVPLSFFSSLPSSSKLVPPPQLCSATQVRLKLGLVGDDKGHNFTFIAPPHRSRPPSVRCSKKSSQTSSLAIVARLTIRRNPR